MTLEQLTAAVIHLGFQGTLAENDALLREAAARALYEVDAACPRYAAGTLYHVPPRPLYELPEALALTGEKTFSLSGARSYLLLLLGCGSVALTEGKETRVLPFASPQAGEPAVLSGDCEGTAASLTVIPQAGSEVILLSLFTYATLLGAAAPAADGRTVYDLQELFPDFAALDGVPTDKNGRPLCEGDGREEGTFALDEGHRLALSNRGAQTVTLRYRKKTALPEKGELPLSPEASTLLPLLCAAYVWLDEDPEKAAFYLARYQEGLSLLRLQSYVEKAPPPRRGTQDWG